jgi:hypothetical protein
MRYLVPTGYVGWFEVRFGVPGASPLSTEYGAYIARVDESGLFETSTGYDFEGLQLRSDKFYYVTPDDRREQIAQTDFGKGGRIWVGGSGCEVDQCIRFFVGSERQWRRFQQLGRDQLGPVPADVAAKADAPFLADRYLIPESFRGWIEVAHGVEDGETAVMVDGFLEITIPLSGRTAVTARSDHHWTRNEFFFMEGAGRRAIPEYYGTQGPNVEAIRSQVTGGPRDSHWFFVGSTDDYVKAGAESGIPP